jgi:hypothetical protein
MRWWFSTTPPREAPPGIDGATHSQPSSPHAPLASFLLPLWEKVAQSSGARWSRLRGLCPRTETPHPPSLREGSLSHKGRGKNPVADFARRANCACALCVICPSCHCAAGRSHCSTPQISAILCVSRLDKRGVRVVTNVECGMRWTLWLRETSGANSGRQSRVVLTPRRWRQVCGAIRRRRWQKSPVAEESAE